MSEELRVATNTVELVGAVKELKNLEVKKNDQGEKYISGNIVVKCGETSEVTLKVFKKELTSGGNVAKAYETLLQIINSEDLTMAKVSEEDAIKIRVTGNKDFSAQFSENMYVPEGENEVKTALNIELGFGNIKIDNNVKPEDYKATFDVEMYVKKVKEEIVKDENTGRAIVEGYIPVYGGKVIPLTVVAGMVDGDDEEEEFDFGNEILGAVEEGQTVNFWGDINYQRLVTKVKKGGSLGRAKTEETITYVHELVTTGAEIIEDENKMYEEEEIQQALVERENKMAEVLANKDDNKKTAKKGLTKSTGGARIDKSKLGQGQTTATETVEKKRPRF